MKLNRNRMWNWIEIECEIRRFFECEIESQIAECQIECQIESQIANAKVKV